MGHGCWRKEGSRDLSKYMKLSHLGKHGEGKGNQTIHPGGENKKRNKSLFSVLELEEDMEGVPEMEGLIEGEEEERPIMGKQIPKHTASKGNRSHVQTQNYMQPMDIEANGQRENRFAGSQRQSQNLPMHTPSTLRDGKA